MKNKIIYEDMNLKSKDIDKFKSIYKNYII
jgi:hypothetical protein